MMRPVLACVAMASVATGALLEATDFEDFVSGANPKGCAFIDYDNDGFQDLFLLSSSSSAMRGKDGQIHGDFQNGLFRNLNGEDFVDVTAETGILQSTDPEVEKGSTSVVAADFNNDGWTDIFVTATGPYSWDVPTTHCLMYENLGNDADSNHLGFLEHPFPEDYACGNTSVASGADINNDGLIDLFVATTIPHSFPQDYPSAFYINKGDWEFESILDDRGEESHFACVTQFTDLDDDGDQDLLVGTCTHWDFDVPMPVPSPIHTYRNMWMEDAGNPDRTVRFSDTDVREEFGINALGFWMGFAFGDPDSDGDLDFFVTNIGTYEPDLVEGVMVGYEPHALFINNGDATFTEAALEHNVGHSGFAWGTAFSDVDNDGNTDLLLTGGMLLGPYVRLATAGVGGYNPGTLYMNTRGDRQLRGDGAMFEFAEDYGLGNTLNSGLAVGDYDNDGFQDGIIMTAAYMDAEQKVLVAFDGSNFGTGEDAYGTGHPKLLHNTAGQAGGIGEGNDWIQIKLEGTYSNRAAIGAKVTVIKSPGHHQEQKQLSAGTSYGSTNSPVLTFGLGNVDEGRAMRPLRVLVKWPRDGAVETFILKSPEVVNSVVTLVEGKGKRRPEE